MHHKSTERVRKHCTDDNLEKVLLEHTRLSILAVLVNGCARFTELQRILGISESSLYFHLKILEEHA